MKKEKLRTERDEQITFVVESIDASIGSGMVCGNYQCSIQLDEYDCEEITGLVDRDLGYNIEVDLGTQKLIEWEII